MRLGWPHRWAQTVLEGFAPTPAEVPLVPTCTVDYASAATRMAAASTPLAAFGIRLAIVVAYLAPVWLELRFGTLRGLSPPQRGAILDRLLRHRFFAIRELTLLLKLIASMAIFYVPEVRARSGYDVPVDWTQEEVTTSGERPRRHLPTVDISKQTG